MAIINIVDLRLRTIIGAHLWERKAKQELIINITLEYDSSKASRSDKLKDALDYELVSNTVIKAVERSRYVLIEKLAYSIFEKLKKFKNIEKITLRIDKPQAIPQARCISYVLST